jgi:predicted HicB family RNase H-like nuclease
MFELEDYKGFHVEWIEPNDDGSFTGKATKDNYQVTFVGTDKDYLEQAFHESVEDLFEFVDGLEQEGLDV